MYIIQFLIVLDDVSICVPWNMAKKISFSSTMHGREEIDHYLSDCISHWPNVFLVTSLRPLRPTSEPTFSSWTSWIKTAKRENHRTSCGARGAERERWMFLWRPGVQDPMHVDDDTSSEEEDEAWHIMARHFSHHFSRESQIHDDSWYQAVKYP